MIAAASSPVRTVTAVGAAACWGVFVLAWVAGALYNVFRGRRQKARPRRGRARFAGVALVLAIVVLVVVRVAPASTWDALTIHAAWLETLGLAVLVCSTALALWARVALGTMWSLSPMVKDRHELRTDGPYGITRHPIYTALLGMLLGTVLAVGLGRSILILPVGLILLELKIRAEEELMLASFPEDYPRYRRRVPQFVPGLRPRGERPR